MGGDSQERVGATTYRVTFICHVNNDEVHSVVGTADSAGEVIEAVKAVPVDCAWSHEITSVEEVKA